MFLLDTLMIAGLRWTLRTVQRAADAEMNDDAALRERLLEAEMQRETGDISDAEFAAVERDVLDRIREIRERRGDGAAALAFGPIGDEPAGGGRLEVEASIGGDFHEAEPPEAARPDVRAAASRRRAAAPRKAHTTARRASVSRSRRRS